MVTLEQAKRLLESVETARFTLAEINAATGDSVDLRKILDPVSWRLDLAYDSALDFYGRIVIENHLATQVLATVA